MFNIIKTPQNYFICELLPDSSLVKGTSLQRKSLAAIFGDKLFGGSVLLANAAPVIGRCLEMLILINYETHEAKIR